MKKRIRGLSYDTETAQEIGSMSSDSGRTDADFFEEWLYKKRTGEFFLYGKGNPTSKYGEYSNAAGGYMQSENIVPIKYEDAKKWCEDYLDDKTYDKEFGEIIKSDKKITKSISISQTAVARLERMSQLTGKNQSELIESLILNN